MPDNFVYRSHLIHSITALQKLGASFSEIGNVLQQMDIKNLSGTTWTAGAVVDAINEYSSYLSRNYEPNSKQLNYLKHVLSQIQRVNALLKTKEKE